MLIDRSDAPLAEAFAALGADLLQLEDPRIGAKEPSFQRLLERATEWFESQRPWLSKAFCTVQGTPRPEAVTGTALLAVVAAPIRAQFGDQFPAESAAAALVLYGLDRFCAEGPSGTQETMTNDRP